MLEKTGVVESRVKITLEIFSPWVILEGVVLGSRGFGREVLHPGHLLRLHFSLKSSKGTNYGSTICSNEPKWFRISVKMPLEAGDDLEQLESIADAFTDTAPHPRYTFEVSALISTKS